MGKTADAQRVRDRLRCLGYYHDEARSGNKELHRRKQLFYRATCLTWSAQAWRLRPATGWTKAAASIATALLVLPQRAMAPHTHASRSSRPICWNAR